MIRTEESKRRFSQRRRASRKEDRGGLRRLVPSLVVSVISGLALSACIAPPAKCACEAEASDAPASANATDSESSGEASAAVAALEVEAVEPTGALLWDGASISLLDSVDPPGSWFVFNDGSPKGSMVPASTGEFESALVNGAIHTKGSGFGEWGGGIGMNFVGAQMLQPVNAKRYKGISFKASGSGTVHVGLATVATMPEFGVCTTCYDHYAVDISDLSSTPKTYTFTWSQLKQAGWGAPKASLDPGTLVGLNFTSKGPTAWDFTVDDVSFLE